MSSAALYEFLYTQPIEALDVEAAAAAWPTWEEQAEEIRSLYDIAEIREKALEEARAKYIDKDAVKAQLETLRAAWPELRTKLQAHLPSRAELAERLAESGAPNSSEQIGIPLDRLRLSYRQALHIRRRFTVLDLADRCGLFAPAMSALFSGEAAAVAK